jgi:FtsP/CotA-like multicopper oxidase with cupredoxin domain
LKRREFARLGWATIIAAGAGKLRPMLGEPPGLQQASRPPQHAKPAPLHSNATEHAADFSLRIAPMMVELAPRVVLSTIGYSNQVPGPLLRMREGQSVTVEVVNDTDVPEYVHWHGLFVPPEIDGVEEEGTPPGSAAWPAPLSIRGQPGGLAVVPLAHRGHAGYASRHLYRPVRVSDDRLRE